MAGRSETLRAGLIGAHISRSQFSRALGILCEAHRIDLVFQPVDSALETGFDFDRAVAACRAEGWTGVSVTHPFKRAAYGLAKTSAQAAPDAIDASNLLLFGQDIQRANTDYSGFISAWRWIFGDRMPGDVCLAGAGGVARALGVALAELGARDIAIWDEDRMRAEELALQIGHPARAIARSEAPEAMRGATGLVNATPLGMHSYPGSAFPDPLPCAPQWAFDAVYTPAKTRFLSSTEAAGADLLSGFDMFRHMALDSFAVYTGIIPDRAEYLTRLAPLRPT